MRYFYWFVQALMWPLAWVLIRIFYRMEIKGRENLKNISGPLIIASNHKTLFDGWLIGIALPFASRFFPLRFMTEELHFRGAALEFLRKAKLLKFFYFLTGGFPSYRGEGVEKAIEYPAKLLEKGGTGLMFPEGRLDRGDGIGAFFHGTSALAIKSGALILPASIRLSSPKIFVSFGPSFKLNPHTVPESTEYLRSKLSELYYA